MRKTVFLIIASIFAASVSIGAAADVGGLNSALVPVADRSDAEYRRGIAKALETVIIKLSGSSAAARSKSARAVVGQAKRLVQQFGYETTDDGRQLLLRVEFDPQVLQKEMRSRGLVVWGKERPETLAWIIVDDQNGRRLLAADEGSDIIRALRKRSRARGIPLLFPRPRASQIGALDGATVAELRRRLESASAEYGVRSVLIGNLREEIPGLWENQWSLTLDGDRRGWEQQGDFIELLVEEAVEQAADTLGARYARPAEHTQAELVTVTVVGLHAAEDYARTERYLNDLDAVSRVFVRQVEGDRLVVELTVQGGLAALAQGISFGQTLRADPMAPATYRLNPR